MKKSFELLLLTIGFFVFNPTQTKADGGNKGVFVGIGPMIGYETNVTGFGGGGVEQVGYRFNERFATLIDIGFFYSRTRVNYYFLPVTGNIKYNFYKEAFGYSDFGYVLLRRSTGIGAFALSENRSGFTTGAGIGYDFNITDHFTIAPQVGFDYYRVDSTNFYNLNSRVMLQGRF